MVNAFLTAALTILGGTLVYALGQLFSKLVLEPAVELRRLCTRVAVTLAYHQNLSPALPGREAREQAMAELPQLGAQLAVQSDSILCYALARRLCNLPTRDEVHLAAGVVILHLDPARTPQAGPYSLAESARNVGRLLHLRTEISLRSAIPKPRERRWWCWRRGTRGAKKEVRPDAS